MKKQYIKPEIVTEIIILESMLANSPSEGMGGNETPGDDNDFNVNDRRGNGWGSLWE